jgi:hypothetical protein
MKKSLQVKVRGASGWVTPQDSLTQSLTVISNRQDAVFAAVTLDRLRSDGCDLQAGRAANDTSFDLLARRVA